MLRSAGVTWPPASATAAGTGGHRISTQADTRPDKRIDSYGLIGDCHSAALVGSDGSIDWLCWPRFDSDSTFAAILGGAEAGRWLIGPASGGTATARRYQDGSLILETRFETADGAVDLIDFMPLEDGRRELVRLVRGRRGRVPMRMELILRFGYGRVVPWVRRVETKSGEALVAVGGPDMTALRSTVATEGSDHTTVAAFEIAEGQEASFELSYSRSFRAVPEALDPSQALGGPGAGGPTGQIVAVPRCRCASTLARQPRTPSSGRS